MNATISNEMPTGGSLHPVCSACRPVDVQIRCPKCGAMRFNVHASDLAKDNGEVTCSNCGHVRIIKTFSAAKPRTSPLGTVDRERPEGVSASPPRAKTKDVNRQPAERQA